VAQSTDPPLKNGAIADLVRRDSILIPFWAIRALMKNEKYNSIKTPNNSIDYDQLFEELE